MSSPNIIGSNKQSSTTGSIVADVTALSPSEGDLILIAAGGDDFSNLDGPPTGYTQVAVTSQTAGFPEIALYAKVATASESNPTVTATSTDVIAIVMIVTGADTSNIASSLINVSAQSEESGSPDPVVSPAVTTTVEDTLLLVMGSGQSADWVAGDEPSTTTLVQQRSSGARLTVAEKDIASASNTGTFTWGNSGATINCGLTAALTPAPNSPGIEVIRNIPGVAF